MAMAICPARTCLELASLAEGSVSPVSPRSTARSVSGSRPSTRAENLWPSASDSEIALADSMTWLLVKMSASGETTTPEPVPLAWRPLRDPATST